MPLASGEPDGRQVYMRVRRHGAHFAKKWGVPSMGHGLAASAQAVVWDCRCAKLETSILSMSGRLPA